MSDILLGALGHRSFHHCIRYWHDFPAYLIWADHHLFSCSVLHHHPCFHFGFIIFIPHFIFFLQWPIFGFGTLFASSLFISSSVCFFLHCIIIATMFTLGTLKSMAHGIYYTCCISYMRAWVLIIGYLSLVSLRFYHPITLAYVTSRVLRPPWGHGIRCRLRQPLLRQVFEIWLMFRYHHASSFGGRLFDV